MAIAMYIMLTRWLQNRSAGTSTVKVGTVVVIASAFALGAAGILWSYQYAATKGFLGEDAESKFETQSSGKYGVLLGGRTEMLASIPAIIDSPILGHGSWAKDPIYLFMQRRALALLGYNFASAGSAKDYDDALIPAHSYFFGAWVNAGILGAIFWAWVYVLAAKSLFRVYPPEMNLVPLIAYVAFEFLWCILFSPYGAEVRESAAYYAMVLISALHFVPRRVLQARSTAARAVPSATTSASGSGLIQPAN